MVLMPDVRTPDVRLNVRVLVTLVALVALGWWSGGRAAVEAARPTPWAGRSGWRGRLDELLFTAKRRGLNDEDSRGVAKGYYEALLDGGRGGAGGEQARTQDLVTGRAGAAGPLERFLRFNPARHERRGDFRVYGLRPNLDQPDRSGRLVTNTAGLADREYARARPAGTRRIALVGDSLSRGMGTLPEERYEARLEAYLDGVAAERGGAVEILDFAVSGYRLTHYVDVVLDDALAWDPDVLLVGVTPLTVYWEWSGHLGQLVNDGRRLKYRYLEELVQRAGLVAGDAPAESERKLEPYRLEFLRWGFTLMRRRAEERGTRVLALLLPSLGDPDEIRAGFAGVPELLAELGWPTIDLLATFARLRDLEPFRIAAGDLHPNGRGHGLLFEALVHEVESRPPLRALLCDPPLPR